MKEKCDILIPESKYHNDILHPCIRYVHEGFCGHKWWLTASPYYNYDDSIENPILFYGDDNGDIPPLKWHFYDVVEESPESGYNSDPNICIDNNELLVLWRKFQTPDVIGKGYNSALFVKKYTESVKSGSEFIIGETERFHYSDLSPILTVESGQYTLYTINFHFTDSIIKRAFSFLLRKIGIGYYVHKTLGLNIYSGKSLSKIELTDTLPIDGEGGADNPWHFDIVKYGDDMFLLLYCRRQKNIYLAYNSENCFKIIKTPLLQTSEVNETYKPTGIVAGDILWLYYSDKIDGQNHLFRKRIDLKKFLSDNIDNI